MEEQMEWLDEAMLADGFEADGWTGTAQEEADDTNAGREVPPPEVMDETQPLGMEMAGLTGAIGAVYGDRLLDEQLAVIHRLAPEIGGMEDLLAMEGFAAFDRMVRQGMDLVTAFKAVHYDQAVRRSAAVARQTALNRRAGVGHMSRVPGQSGADDGAEIPKGALPLWREMFPGESMAQLKRRYNEARQDG